MPTVHLDSRDQRLVDERMRARAVLEADDRPLAGDLVRMPDGALRRIARHWRDDSGWDGGVQLSAGGRFHLTRSGDCSFSGTLDPTIPPGRLRLTGERAPAPLWIFHHDIPGGGRGVDATAAFRVWQHA